MATSPRKSHQEGSDFFDRIFTGLLAQALVRLIIAVASRWPHEWPF